MARGWKKEPARHALAARGVKTSQTGHRRAPRGSKRSTALTLDSPIRTMDGEVTTFRKLREEERLGLYISENWRDRGRKAHFADVYKGSEIAGSWKISKKLYDILAESRFLATKIPGWD